MCDEETVRDAEAAYRQGRLSRREFGRGLSATALAAMLPAAAGAADVEAGDVTVPMPDGEMDAFLARPATGRHPGVILWPDIKGIRPAFRLMGKRLAASGYTVVVVNPYYRTHRGELISEGESFRDPVVRERLMPHARSLSPDTCVADGGALIEYLDAHPSVDVTRPIGVMGYCMTGSYTIRLAAAYPGRVGAGASFHGGGLATDAEDSPHRLAPGLRAGFLVAIAENDDAKEPDAKRHLREAFDAADVEAEIEVYAGTLHGWCPPDSDVYNEAQAERAWERLLALFERELA